MKTLKIACTGYSTAPLAAFKELQGELKFLAPKEYESLRSELLEQGFSFPINAWRDGETLWILDGHQRTRALRRMQEDGIEVPDLPYSITEAASYQDAKLKCLAAASQYGRPTEAGLVEFLKDIEITPIRLENFPLPNISMPQFVQSHFRITETPDAKVDPSSEWKGMPEFDQEDKTSLRRIVVNFKSQDDVEVFAKLIGQDLTEKTRSIWFPEAEIEKMMDKRYQ